MSSRWQIEAVVIEYGGMPILRHAIKKLRVDARRTQVNKRVRTITKKRLSLFELIQAKRVLSRLSQLLIEPLRNELSMKEK